MPTLAVWCRVVRSRDVHPCDMVPWCRVVQSRDVSPHNFDRLAMSGSRFQSPRICTVSTFVSLCKYYYYIISSSSSIIIDMIMTG